MWVVNYGLWVMSYDLWDVRSLHKLIHGQKQVLLFFFFSSIGTINFVAQNDKKQIKSSVGTAHFLTNNKQQTTNNKQQTTNNKQQTTNNSKNE